MRREDPVNIMVDKVEDGLEVQFALLLREVQLPDELTSTLRVVQPWRRRVRARKRDGAGEAAIVDDVALQPKAVRGLACAEDFLFSLSLSHLYDMYQLVRLVAPESKYCRSE